MGRGTPDGAGKPLGGEPEPIGNGGAVSVVTCLSRLMGDAAARAEKAAKRMVVACMLAIVCPLSGFKSIVDVDALRLLV